VILRRLIFIALSAVIYVAPSAFAQAVRASYSGLSGQNLPFWLTYDAGLYKKYGLSTEIVLISGGLTNIQAVMANEIAFTYLGGASPIQGDCPRGRYHGLGYRLWLDAVRNDRQ
jgi:ABC-type nitrate/sulfonate/bicarbonate transport system substrate-binding protein